MLYQKMYELYSKLTMFDMVIFLCNQYIEDIQMFVVNMTFISSCEVKKYIFHECKRYDF